MGLMIAGSGMLAYVSRSGLGSGPNLSLTVLYLGLIQMTTFGCQFGTLFNVLLDNTCEANKNNEMIFFLAWLVAMDYFEEASFFCMVKGHTYSRIDQSFRALIGRLLSTAIWTVPSLLHHIFKYLQVYNCLGVYELPHLWDWVDFFKPHVHDRFGGFATGQFGSGMHEVLLRKNREGKVRVPPLVSVLALGGMYVHICIKLLLTCLHTCIHC